MTVMDEPVLPASTVTMPDAYGSAAKWFHWVTVVLIAIALPVGFVIQHIKDADKMPFYAIHESAGLTILFVALARLAWRLRTRRRRCRSTSRRCCGRPRRRCTIRCTCC